MKKIWIILIILLGFIIIGVFSTSFGKEEIPLESSPDMRNCYNRISETSFWS